jgi:hypothetical protein
VRIVTPRLVVEKSSQRSGLESREVAARLMTFTLVSGGSRRLRFFSNADCVRGSQVRLEVLNGHVLLAMPDLRHDPACA